MCIRDRCGAEHQERNAPVEPVGKNSRAHAAREATQRGSADVKTHDESEPIWRPLPVSYTHLDVYKRQVQQKHVGSQFSHRHGAESVERCRGAD